MSKLSQNGYSTFIVITLIMAMSLVMLTGIFQIKNLHLSSQSSLNDGETARHLVRSCEEAALLSIKNDAAFIGARTLSIGGRSCDYVVVNATNGLEKIVRSSAGVGQAKDRSTIEISSVSGQITIKSTTQQ
jgi:hypothetical protein